MAMPVTHEPWLVALSLVVAIQGAYVGLSLAVQVGGTIGVRRRWLLAGSALSLGVAIWSMHFVAMLAARLPFPVDYLVLPTLLSFLVCVLVVGAAVFAVGAGPLTMTRLVAAAVFMGLGIVSMHYIGMAALHDSAHMTHNPSLVGASVAIAIATSGLALRLATRTGRTPLFLSAIALGFAISGMHYTAMGAVKIYPHIVSLSSAPALSIDLLAIVVAVVAFVVSGLFFLVLVPERGPTRPVTTPAAPDSAEPFASVPADAVAAPEAGSAAVVMAAGAEHSATGEGAKAASPADVTRHLPVEHDGARHLLPVDSVVAVHANAHYTYVFDGTAKYFCPLAIGDVESRLDPTRFARVHRSHIINVEHVLRFRRAGDNGVIELKGRDAYTVPVSRSRLAWVRAQIPGPKTPATV
jgi:NO-binding membrane sensor protein with MHYT domain